MSQSSSELSIAVISCLSTLLRILECKRYVAACWAEFLGKYKRIKDDKQESDWMEKKWQEEYNKDPGK